MDANDDENNPKTETEQDVQVSHCSDQKDSASSGKQNENICEDNESSSQAQTKAQEPNQDSDNDPTFEQERSNASIYSEDYDDSSQSDISLSQHFPSPPPAKEVRAKKTSSTAVCKKGVRNDVPRHLCNLPHLPPKRLSNQRLRSISKNGPSKDQDEVAKRLLSARLMKISELKNALAELQMRSEELQKENRLLKQLQMRHEKALHRYSDTEGGISQLILRHNNEVRVMQEKLRRSQEKERLAERRSTEADTQLQRCRDQLHKLQQLADDQSLGERDQLARKLAHAQVKLQESERKVKDLEKKLELSNGSFQRQLAGERKKTYYAHQETQKLWLELNTLSAKLKERNRELDSKNIYVNRKPKASRKDLEDFIAMKDGSRNSSKAVQTENGLLPPDLSTPPSAAMNDSEFSCGDQADGYLSLKERQSSKGERRQTGADVQTIQETAREPEEGTKLTKQERKNDNLRESERELENKKEALRKQRINSDSGKEKGTETESLGRDEEDSRTPSKWWQSKEVKAKDKQPHLSKQEIQANQERAEEEHRLKDQLLAKMREIDMQAEAQDTSFFNFEEKGACTPPQDQDTTILHLKELHENPTTPKAGRRGGTQKANQDLDLAFGSYAPTFDKPAIRTGIVHGNSSQGANQSSGDNNDLSALANGKKSDLMGQLFGASASPACHVSTRKMELLSSSSTKDPSSGRRKTTEVSNSQKSTTINVFKSGPAVRAITTLSDDIEELKL